MTEFEQVITDEQYRAAQDCYFGHCTDRYGEGCDLYVFGIVQALYIAEIRTHDCKASGCHPYFCTAFES